MCIVRYSRHKKNTTFIDSMELVSLRCNREFTSAESVGLQLSDTSDTSRHICDARGVMHAEIAN